MLRSIFIFVLAGFAEIGGGYLVWLWLRESKPLWYGVVGGWFVDKKTPDMYDWLGAAICSVGVSIMLWAPRS